MTDLWIFGGIALALLLAAGFIYNAKHFKVTVEPRDIAKELEADD